MKLKKSKKQLFLSQEFHKDAVHTVTKFLWLPTCVEGEWRWLETATIERIAWPKEKWYGTKFYWLNIGYEDSNSIR